MTPGGRPDWHVFRCPVCGHRDEVKLAELSGARIDCPHCETALNVEVGPASSIDASARVAERGAHRPADPDAVRARRTTEGS